MIVWIKRFILNEVDFVCTASSSIIKNSLCFSVKLSYDIFLMQTFQNLETWWHHVHWTEYFCWHCPWYLLSLKYFLNFWSYHHRITNTTASSHLYHHWHAFKGNKRTTEDIQKAKRHTISPKRYISQDSQTELGMYTKTQKCITDLKYTFTHKLSK